MHYQVDKVLQKLTSILGIHVPPYTPDVDPTRIIKRSLEMGLKPKNVDWTITSEANHFNLFICCGWTMSSVINMFSVCFLASSISKLKALVEERKGKSKSDSKKPRNTRKRRRPANQDDDSSSDESEIPKPKFTVNDEDTLPPPKRRSSTTDAKDISLPYGVPLDLSGGVVALESPEKKEDVEIKVEQEQGSSDDGVGKVVSVTNNVSLLSSIPILPNRSAKLEDIIVNLKREHEQSKNDC